jgi:hypothetical protein
MIRVSIDWQGKKGLDNLIRYIENNLVYAEAQEQIRVLGHHTADHMRNTISTSKKRHSFGSNLEDNILAETLDTTGGVEVGIGRISQLKANAPYFEVLDVGGYVPYSTAKGAPLGSFEGDAPSSSVVSGNQNWERSGNKGFFMKPKSPIEGIDYIGKAIRNLDKELKDTMEKLGAKFVGDMEKQTRQHGWGMGAGGAK